MVSAAEVTATASLDANEIPPVAESPVEGEAPPTMALKDQGEGDGVGAGSNIDS